MDFNCPSCNKSGNIDDAKLPESGVYATCPQCNNKFLMKPKTPKDFEYEAVLQAESQQASVKAVDESTQSDGGAGPSDDSEPAKAPSLSVQPQPTVISTKPLKFFFSWVIAALLAKIISSKVTGVAPIVAGISVGVAAVFGLWVGTYLGNFVGNKINDSYISKTNKNILAWVTGFVSFIILIFISMFIINAAPNYSPPSRTTSQPEYSLPQTTEKLPTAPKAASQPEYSQGFRLDDTVVTDLRTGLMWTRDANLAGKEMNWYDADKWVKSLSIGGYRDWRLPTENELRAMRNYFEYRSAESLNRLGFTNVQGDAYLSSSRSTFEATKGYIMCIYMTHGYREAAAIAAEDAHRVVDDSCIAPGGERWSPKIGQCVKVDSRTLLKEDHLYEHYETQTLFRRV